MHPAPEPTIAMIHRPTSIRARAGAPRLRSFACAAAMLAGVLGCSESGILLPDDGPPEALEFSTGGYGGGSRSVQVRGDTVVLRRSSWTGDQRDSVRAVPAPGEWRAFWQASERAGVGRWQRRYQNERVADGVGWYLRIEIDGAEFESTGANAYPDAFGRERHEPTDAYNDFVDALGDLVGEPLYGEQD
jgi:hypothetical protein